MTSRDLGFMQEHQASHFASKTQHESKIRPNSQQVNGKNEA